MTVKNVNWIFYSQVDGLGEKRLIGKDPDAGEDWGQEENGGQADGWIASSIQWAWAWVNSGRWWRTGKPGVLQFMGSQSQTQLNSMMCSRKSPLSWLETLFSLCVAWNTPISRDSPFCLLWTFCLIKVNDGMSLVVQWLRLHTHSARDPSSVPGGN